MPFPASQITLSDAEKSISSVASRIKVDVESAATKSDLSRTDLAGLQLQLTRTVNVWDTNASIEGLPQYMRDQYNNQGLDIAVEYVAMKAEAVVLRDLIFAALDGEVLQTLLVGGGYTPILMTAGQRNAISVAPSGKSCVSCMPRSGCCSGGRTLMTMSERAQRLLASSTISTPTAL